MSRSACALNGLIILVLCCFYAIAASSPQPFMLLHHRVLCPCHILAHYVDEFPTNSFFANTPKDTLQRQRIVTNQPGISKLCPFCGCFVSVFTNALICDRGITLQNLTPCLGPAAPSAARPGFYGKVCREYCGDGVFYWGILCTYCEVGNEAVWPCVT